MRTIIAVLILLMFSLTCTFIMTELEGDNVPCTEGQAAVLELDRC